MPPQYEDLLGNLPNVEIFRRRPKHHEVVGMLPFEFVTSDVYARAKVIREVANKYSKVILKLSTNGGRCMYYLPEDEISETSNNDENYSSRPSIDEYFAEITRVISKRSTCLRRKVGAILVRDRRILSTGYNGAPSKMLHCKELGCLRDKYDIPSGERTELCRAIHAEQNAIIQCAIHGTSTEGATLYTLTTPCITCAKILINAKVSEVVCLSKYGEFNGLNMLKEAGIKVRCVEDKNYHKGCK